MNRFDPDIMVDKYVQYRDYIKRAEDELKTKLAPYREAMRVIEGQLNLALGSAQSIKLPSGTAYRSKTASVRMADRGMFDEFVHSQGNNLSYFTNHVSKELVLEHVEQFGAAPPGLDVTIVQNINVRRS